MSDLVDEFITNSIVIESTSVDSESIPSSPSSSSTSDKVVIDAPKRVFIVPYRNRLQQKFFFSQQMQFILEGQDDYEILFVHQMDSRPFNRGAMKNIGFIAIKEKYPDAYKDITFIFNDVDTLPFHKLFDYQTVKGVVRHYYGFETALGGIVVIKGGDFEMVNGYPNYWGWGMEDACLQNRCKHFNIKIDRSTFYKIGSPEILQLFDGVARLVCAKDPARMKADNGYDGVKTVHKLVYTIDKESANPNDNVYISTNTSANALTFYVNVNTFMTLVRFESDIYHDYDLRDPVSKVTSPDSGKPKSTAFVNNTADWKNIPFMPHFQERKATGPIVKQPLQQMHQQMQPQKMQQQQQQMQQQQMIGHPFSYANNRNYPTKATKSALVGMSPQRK